MIKKKKKITPLTSLLIIHIYKFANIFMKEINTPMVTKRIEYMNISLIIKHMTAMARPWMCPDMKIGLASHNVAKHSWNQWTGEAKTSPMWEGLITGQPMK